MKFELNENAETFDPNSGSYTLNRLSGAENLPLQDNSEIGQNEREFLENVNNISEDLSISEAVDRQGTFRGIVQAGINLFVDEGDFPENRVDPEFDSFDRIEEVLALPKAFQQKVIDSRNSLEFEERIIEAEEAQAARDVRDGAGFWESLVPYLADELLNPINLVAGGSVIRGAARGVSVARTALSGASAGFTAGALSEPFRQTADESRTASDAVFEIGADTVFGGLLGGIGGKLVKSSDVSKIRKQFEIDLDSAAKLENTGAAKELEALQNSFSDGSIGAAEYESALSDVFKTADLGVINAASFGLNLSPTLKFAKAVNPEARKLYAQLAESALFSVGDQSGTGRVRSVELASLDRERYGDKVIDGLSKDYKSYRKRIKGTGEERLSFQQYSEAIFHHIIDGATDDIVPEIAQSASRVRELNVKFLNEAKAAGLEGFENLTDADAFTYVHRMYDRDLILKLEGTDKSFKETVLRPHVARTHASRVNTARNKYLKKIDAIDKKLSKTKGSKTKTDLRLKKENLQEKLAKLINDPNDPTYADDINEIVDKIYNSIVGNEAGSVHAATKDILGGANKRTLLGLSTKEIAPFLVRDITNVVGTYSKDIGSTISFKEAFGTLDSKDVIDQLSKSYDKLIANETDPKKIDLLKKERASLTKEARGVIDVLRGQTGAKDAIAKNAERLKKFTYMAYLGKVVLSSLPDVHRLVTTNGFLNVFGTVTREIVTGFKGYKLAKNIDRDVLLGGTEHVSSLRMKFLTDIYGDSTSDKLTGFDRLLDNMSKKFTQFTGMNLWNNTMKTWSSLFTQSRIASAVKKVSSGQSLPKSEIKMLSRIGLSNQDIINLSKKSKLKGDNGFKVIDVENLEDRDLRVKVRDAVRRQADIDIVTPSVGDLPLSIRTNPYVSLLGQFRGFAIASHNRMLLAGIQQRDANAASGLFFALAMGMLKVKVDMDFKGEDTSDWTTQEWVASGLDASGLLSVYMMGSGFFEALDSDIFTLHDLMGKTAYDKNGLSRPKNVGDYVLGASGSLANKVFKGASDAVGGTIALTEGDTEEASKLFKKSALGIEKALPFQNLWAKELLENSFQTKGFFDKISKALEEE